MLKFVEIWKFVDFFLVTLFTCWYIFLLWDIDWGFCLQLPACFRFLFQCTASFKKLLEQMLLNKILPLKLFSKQISWSCNKRLFIVLRKLKRQVVSTKRYFSEKTIQLFVEWESQLTFPLKCSMTYQYSPTYLAKKLVRTQTSPLTQSQCQCF